MPRTPARITLLLTAILFAACDDTGEVDRGAKPIEALHVDADASGLASVRLGMDDVELDALHHVATGTVGGAPLAMILDDDGTILGAAVHEHGAAQWLDVEALVRGDLELLDGPPSDLSSDAAELLRRLVDRVAPAEASSHVDELAQPADPTPVQCPPPFGGRGTPGRPNC